MTPPAIRNFVPVIWLADIVAVNGKPAKGTWTVRGTLLFRSTATSPGNAVADSGAAFFFDWVFDVRQVDGTQVGTIMASGWGGAAKPPGAPASFLQANMAVTGGTGAFLGVRGQGAQGGNFIDGRIASMTEDPAYRRINGGGSRRYVERVPRRYSSINIGVRNAIMPPHNCPAWPIRAKSAKHNFSQPSSST